MDKMRFGAAKVRLGLNPLARLLRKLAKLTVTRGTAKLTSKVVTDFNDIGFQVGCTMKCEDITIMKCEDITSSCFCT